MIIKILTIFTSVHIHNAQTKGAKHKSSET